MMHDVIFAFINNCIDNIGLDIIILFDDEFFQ